MQVQESVGDQTPNVGDEGIEKKEAKTIDQKDHERAINDALKYKKKAQEVELRAKQLEDAIKSQETEKMKQSNMFKELAEKYENENRTLKETLKKKDESYISTQKFNTLHAAALREGLRKEAESDLEYIPLEDVEAEYTSNGRIIVRGADDYVKKLKTLKPHWFNDNTAVKFNGGGTSNSKVDDGNITTDTLSKLKFSDPKKYKEMLPKWVEQKNKRS